MLMLLTLAIPALLLGASFGGDDDEDLNETIRGDDSADTIDGGVGNDFVVGNGGDDLLQGGAGNDVLFGNEGEDVLIGGDDMDMLCSGDDDDVVSGNRGRDTIEGQGGDDWVNGDYSADTVTGGEGDDTVIGDRGTDVLAGQEGNDIILGGLINGSPTDVEGLTALRDGVSLADVLDNDQELRVRDDSFADTLYGGDGNDQLILGGADVGTGGEGADIFNIFERQIAEGVATITDMTSEDSLAVVIQGSETPDLSIAADNGDAVLRSGDTVLAVITGAAGQIDLADVAIVRSGDLAQLLDPNA